MRVMRACSRAGGNGARHRVPAVYPFPYFAIEGGLIAYGPDSDDLDADARAALKFEGGDDTAGRKLLGTQGGAG